ncbi:hypothetical protein R5R35_004290 [Gryllus longicercus]|uniref:Uncharacterized protein n=1 Tax=Gryllus longicercus TaxID=2509291 RepID=A0AAN9ZEM4_9ORTH
MAEVHRCWRLNVRLLRVSGLWPRGGSTVAGRALGALHWAVCVALFLSFYFSGAVIAFYSEGVHDLGQNLSVALTNTLTFVKLLPFLLWRRRVTQAIDRLGRDLYPAAEQLLSGAAAEALVRGAERRARRISLGVLCFVEFAALSAISAPLAELATHRCPPPAPSAPLNASADPDGGAACGGWQPRLPFNAWFPWDWTTAAAYPFTYILQVRPPRAWTAQLAHHVLPAGATTTHSFLVLLLRVPNWPITYFLQEPPQLTPSWFFLLDGPTGPSRTSCRSHHNSLLRGSSSWMAQLAHHVLPARATTTHSFLVLPLGRPNWPITYFLQEPPQLTRSWFFLLNGPTGPSRTSCRSHHNSLVLGSSSWTAQLAHHVLPAGATTTHSFVVLPLGWPNWPITYFLQEPPQLTPSWFFLLDGPTGPSLTSCRSHHNSLLLGSSSWTAQLTHHLLPAGATTTHSFLVLPLEWPNWPITYFLQEPPQLTRSWFFLLDGPTGPSLTSCRSHHNSLVLGSSS